MGNKYKITQNYKIPAGVAGNYRKGYKRPEGVVIHASANPNASIDSEISYMAKNYKNAFTHAWAGHNKIIEIANTNYACWGAGGVANKRFVQIEMTEDKRLTKQQKIQVVDHAAYWAAVQLVYYGLPCTDASKGSGTVWGHTHVTKYLGGTTHTDPIAFLRSLGLTWDDVYKQTKRYYDAYKKGTSDQVKSLDGTQGTSTPKPTPSKPSKPANKTIEQLADEVIDGKHGTGEARKKALGSNYKAVQDLVNKKLGAKSTSNSKPKGKSWQAVAREIYQGKGGWGNDPERTRKLKNAGYNAKQVQAEVNRLIRENGRSNRKVTKGSRVTISNTAKKYATGETIPNWVKGNTYTVMEVGSGKVLLREIMSWVYTTDLVNY